MENKINRFKWARKNLKHETVQTVATNTGITRSLIDELETNAGKERAVGYQKIKVLALYYGVSIDWLLEILPFDKWSTDEDARIAAEQTGLSSKSLEQLNKYSSLSKKGTGYFNVFRLKEAYDFFITNSSASTILTQLYTYIYADFKTAYRRNADAGLSIVYNPYNIEDIDDSIPSSTVNFLLNDEHTTKGSAKMYFSLSEEEYADAFLKRITEEIRKLRKKESAKIKEEKT